MALTRISKDSCTKTRKCGERQLTPSPKPFHKHRHYHEHDSLAGLSTDLGSLSAHPAATAWPVAWKAVLHPRRARNTARSSGAAVAATAWPVVWKVCRSSRLLGVGLRPGYLRITSGHYLSHSTPTHAAMVYPTARIPSEHCFVREPVPPSRSHLQ